LIRALSDIMQGDDQAQSPDNTERQAGIGLIDRGSALVEQADTQEARVDCSTPS
jgi:hypothetical protein